MPIDGEQFVEGEVEGSIERRILDLLFANPNTAYNTQEIALEVMDIGISERNVDRPSDLKSQLADFLDLATVSTILDDLVDTGEADRRLVDTGEGLRSYYRAPPTVEGHVDYASDDVTSE